MNRAKAAAAYFGRVLEFRLRAFIYAMLAVVGFVIGTMNATDRAVDYIAKYEQATRQAVLAAKS